MTTFKSIESMKLGKIDRLYEHNVKRSLSQNRFASISRQLIHCCPAVPHSFANFPSSVPDATPSR